MTDLTALGGTLSLEAGVVGIALTDAGEVVSCTENGQISGRSHGATTGDVLLTVPPEVAESGTETYRARISMKFISKAGMSCSRVRVVSLPFGRSRNRDIQLGCDHATRLGS
jgi:hypothetical protein